ncbi:MAG: carbohydrate kinase family protein [bacterium]|nr:carbohydrate kinase family protein [bacterium]MDZ4232038.1 carbohydrate kinase family protein [Candidatus Pacearchaeota archaeon]
MRTYDVISIGDTTLDVFLELEEETKVISDPRSRKRYLGLVFAEKIPVKKFTSIPAVGNSANVAVGTSRLALKTAFYTHLGDDSIGEEMRSILVQEGVAPEYIQRDKGKASNFSAVLNYKAERTILVHHEHRKYRLPKFAPARWVYFSSVAPGHEKLHSQIPLYIKKTGAKLAFNPGSFQLHEGASGLKKILAVSTVLFCNRQEAQDIVGREMDIKKLLEKLRGLGPEIAVITDGPKGSYSYDGERFLFLKIFPAPLVERTGAGDAYSTGFISALAHGKDVGEAMRWGTINSASVIQRIGAREGLLKKKEMAKMVAARPRFQPRQL